MNWAKEGSRGGSICLLLEVELGEGSLMQMTVTSFRKLLLG